VGVLAAGWYLLHFSPDEMQTLTFVMLVFANQGLLYVLRERRHFWRSRPAGILVAASLSDVAVVGGLAAGGILMSPLPLATLALLLVATLALVIGMDWVKLAVFARLRPSLSAGVDVLHSPSAASPPRIETDERNAIASHVSG
jgi:H+-transporting ATPase